MYLTLQGGRGEGIERRWGPDEPILTPEYWIGGEDVTARIERLCRQGKLDPNWYIDPVVRDILDDWS